MQKTLVALLLTVTVVGLVEVLGGCKSKEERERAKQRKEDSLYVEKQIEHLDSIPDDQVENAIALCDQYGWSDSVLVSEKAKRAVLDGYIRKQVIGAYELDILTSFFKEGKQPGAYMEKETWRDSVIRYEINKITQVYGFSGEWFLEEAHILDIEIISEISAQGRALFLEEISPRAYQKVSEYSRNNPEVNYLPEEELIKIVRRLMLETVEEICRDSGYIPPDFQDRLETARKYF